MISKSLLKSYATALYSVAKESDRVEEVKQDLSFLCALFSRDPEFVKFLSSPMITKVEKDEMLEKTLKGQINVCSYSFLQVLINRKNVSYLPKISEQYGHCYNREHGILEGRVYTPFPLEENTLKKLEDIFSEKYDKKVTFKVILDKRVLAGMKVYVDDTLYDYSVDTKLNQVRDKVLKR